MGGGAPSSQTTTQQVQLPGWAASWAQQNADTAESLASQPYNPYTGPEVAPLSADQQAAQTGVEGLTGYTAPAFTQAIGNVTNLPQTTQSLLNPYLGSVEGDVVSNINRSAALTGQQMNAQAANVGAFGGTRTGVEQGELASETQRNIGQAVDQIQAQGYTTAQQAALQQASELGTLATGGQAAQLAQLGALNTVGGQAQTQQQATYANALQQYQAAQNWPYQQLSIAQSALAGTPYGNQVTASQPYNSNATASALGLAAAAIPLANTLGTSTGLWGGTGGGLLGSGLSSLGSWLGLGGGAASAASAGTALAAGAGSAAPTGAALDAALAGIFAA